MSLPKRHKSETGGISLKSSTLIENINGFILRTDNSFAGRYCRQQWARKLVLPGEQVDTRTPAINRFRLMEARMELVNQQLVSDNTDTRGYISVAREQIHRLLPESCFSIEELQRSVRYTGGACFHMRRSPSGVQDKYWDAAPTSTLSCAPLFLEMISGTALEKVIYNRSTQLTFNKSGRKAISLQLVRGSRITTVPKNNKTDRTIEISPSANVYCQKGIAGVIKRRLRSVGIDLSDQNRNREAARRGMFTGHATIDLANASDSISLELARQVLPERLFELLLMVRCDEYSLDKVWYPCHKLSSMGNACTFEVETLIFWALSRAIQIVNGRSLDVLVYGDDIIVPVDDVPDILRLFPKFGFEVNAGKSFWDIMFRESCGLHSFRGRDVTPFYVKALPSTVPEMLILINKLRRWQLRIIGFINEQDQIWSWLFSKLPASIRSVRIPDGHGDGAAIGEPTPVYKHGIRMFRVIKARTSKETSPPLGALVATLALNRPTVDPLDAFYRLRKVNHLIVDEIHDQYDKLQEGVLSQYSVSRRFFDFGWLRA